MSAIADDSTLPSDFRATDLRSPPPSPTARGIGLAAVFWGLYTILYGLLIARGQDVTLSRAVFSQLVANAFLALYSVPVWWLTVRRMQEWAGGWVLALHAGIAPLYAWAGLESYLLFYDVVFNVPLRTRLAEQYRWVFFANLAVYALQFAIYHLIQNVRRLQQNKQQAAELLARAREQEMAALKAQINPHFLFNTLNSISATLAHAPDEARTMISRLARLLRYALDSTDRDRVPLRSELDFVRRYLALEQHRFSDRLTATVDVSVADALLDTPVPPMILQPLVENALEHGIAPSETGGAVRVRVTSHDDRLRVAVTDTGVGLDDEVTPLSPDSRGRGLTNTSTRLKRTYGPDAALQTAPHVPRGSPSGLRSRQPPTDLSLGARGCRLLEKRPFYIYM